mmetsp:Transcript_33289/g.39889  ORF Transcript_33289/g.39889 Transcript_33289/m.39889 type:complete len:186 (-) Transcript_33289:628-1185(-)
MTLTPIRLPPIIAILLVTFTVKATCAFVHTITFERKSRVDPSKINDDPHMRILQQQFCPPIERRTKTSTYLKNTPNCQHNRGSPTGHNGILSSTARESAVTAEWEPILEFQRHYEEEDCYKNFASSYERDSKEKRRRREKVHQNHDWSEEKIQVVNGVFCGYRFTKEECLRLRSANPAKSDDFSI